jgi:hypothetical protein
MAGKKREVVVAGIGNVFRDRGLADSGERKLRVQLAARLNELIDEHRLGQAAVAQRRAGPVVGAAAEARARRPGLRSDPGGSENPARLPATANRAGTPARC